MSWKEVVGLIALIVIVICMMYQRRALNKIAFGRSMFISWSAIVMGFLVGLLPTIEAGVVSVVLLLLGFGMIVFMGVKSFQHLRKLRYQQRTRDAELQQ
jgi:uncharacterized membrane protein